MAISGFEGFEKRLELRFSGDDPLGLRRLTFEALEQVLDAVQCTVVSAAGNRSFDAYVLSESSLFVYPNKLIIKTCGTTQLLRSVPCLLELTGDMGLRLCGCRYTRGSFIFPKAQPFPHTSFREEVLYLEETLPSALCYRKACVLPSKTPHSWHVYSASDHHQTVSSDDDPYQPAASSFTVEVCMTQLDKGLARRFFRRPGDVTPGGDLAGREMTEWTGIREINPRALICDFAFDPCGYSMNGIDGDSYSTIHVTPEEGYSYASYECVGRVDGYGDVGELLKRVARVFRPGFMSVSVCVEREGCDGRLWSLVANALKPLGLHCRGREIEELPGTGTIAHQTFTMRRK